MSRFYYFEKWCPFSHKTFCRSEIPAIVLMLLKVCLAVWFVQGLSCVSDIECGAYLDAGDDRSVAYC